MKTHNSKNKFLVSQKSYSLTKINPYFNNPSNYLPFRYKDPSFKLKYKGLLMQKDLYILNLMKNNLNTNSLRTSDISNRRDFYKIEQQIEVANKKELFLPKENTKKKLYESYSDYIKSLIKTKFFLLNNNENNLKTINSDNNAKKYINFKTSFRKEVNQKKLEKWDNIKKRYKEKENLLQKCKSNINLDNYKKNLKNILKDCKINIDENQNNRENSNVINCYSSDKKYHVKSRNEKNIKYKKKFIKINVGFLLKKNKTEKIISKTDKCLPNINFL